MSRDPLDYCPGCERYRSIDEWALGKGEKLPDSGAFLCRECRAAPPKLENPDVASLEPCYRRLLRDMMTCRSVGDVARKHGVTSAHIRAVLRGATKPTEIVRDAFQRLMETEGLDLYTIARLGRLILHATEPKWNSKEEDWDFFPDHHARMKAIQWFGRMHDIEPRNSGQFKAKTMVIIQNNLGDGTPPDPIERGDFVIDVESESEAVEANDAGHGVDGSV